MLVKIALCDDNSLFLDQGERALKTVVESLDKASNTGDELTFEIDAFSDGLSLVEKVKKGTIYQIILLDWEMPVMDGGQVGREICVLCPSCLIIYLTAYKDFGMKAIQSCSPFNYILKESLGQDLPKVLNNAIEKVKKNLQLAKDAFFCKDIEGKNTKILLSRLLYVEHKSRANFFFYEDQIIQSVTGDNLKQYESFLLAHKFLNISRGIWVNSTAVTQFAADHVTLKNGTELTVSRNARRGVLTTMMQTIEIL